MFKLEEIEKNIFHLSFDHRYDLGMHFVRLQEYYECPNDKFRNKPFELLDFMEWYSKEHDCKFTYPRDWSGFNIPGEIMERHVFMLKNDENKYDKFMEAIYKLIKLRVGYSKFYLIGTDYSDDAIDHEIAHAIWYLDCIYKIAQKKNLDALSIEVKNQLTSILKETGYEDRVMDDEIQAYMSTGLISEMKSIKSINKMRKPFINTFKNFRKKK